MAGRSSRQVQHSKDPQAPVVLEVRSLAKSFFIKSGLFGKREFKAVQGVSFRLRKGHTLGVVGESGSGKTTMGLTLLRLHEPTGGEVRFDGRNLLTLSDAERQQMRTVAAPAKRGELLDRAGRQLGEHRVGVERLDDGQIRLRRERVGVGGRVVPG